MAIILTLISVCCGCLGAVLALEAGLGLLSALMCYMLAGALGSGLTVLWTVQRTQDPRPTRLRVPSAQRR